MTASRSQDVDDVELVHVTDPLQNLSHLGNITLNCWFFSVQSHLRCNVAIQSFVDVPFLLFFGQYVSATWLNLVGGVSEVEYVCARQIIINLNGGKHYHL